MSSVVSSLAPAVGTALGGPVGGAIGTAIGGALAPKPKGPSVSQAQFQTQAPAYIQPLLEQAATESQKLFESGQLGQYPQLSPLELSTIQQGIGMTQAGAPLTPEAQFATGQLLGGASSFLSPAQQIFERLAAAPPTTSTPEFQAALESAISPVIQRTTSRFGEGGRLGSGLFGEALGSGIASAAAPAVLQAQQADLKRQLSAATGLADIGRLGIGAMEAGARLTPSIGSLGFGDIDRRLQLAGLLSQEDLLRRQQDAQALREYQDLIQGSMFGQTETRPVYSAPQYSTSDNIKSAISGQLIDYGTGMFGDFLGGLGKGSGGGSGGGGLNLQGYELGGALGNFGR
jgi:hypothetical protein